MNNTIIIYKVDEAAAVLATKSKCPKQIQNASLRLLYCQTAYNYIIDL